MTPGSCRAEFRAADPRNRAAHGAVRRRLFRGTGATGGCILKLNKGRKMSVIYECQI
jgi:hypothetical protein